MAMADLGKVQLEDGAVIARNRPMSEIIRGVPRLPEVLCELAYVDGADVVLCLTAASGKPTTITLRGAADKIARAIVLG